jgi:hypothetical protein
VRLASAAEQAIAGSDEAVATDAAAALALAAFRLDAADCARGALAPGNHCDVDVSFAPVHAGTIGAILLVSHDAEGGVYRALLSGRGTAPRIHLDAAQRSFGRVPLGTVGDWRPVEIANHGTAALDLHGLDVLGTDRGSFEVTADGCRRPVPPGQGCSAQVRFTPRRDGPHRAELRIRHDGGADIRVVLNGIGVSPRLEARPPRLDFGTTDRGVTRDLRLRNVGRADLEVLSVRLTGALAEDFEIVANECDRVRLAAGRDCRVAVRFFPRRPGARRAQLEVRHGADDAPLQVPLDATGIP